MGKLGTIIAKAGLLSPDMIAEFQKWGFPQEPVEVQEMTLEDLLGELEAAMNSEDMVAMRVTDPEIIKEWGSSLTKGRLMLELEDGSRGEVEVLFGKTRTGEYILPWRSDTISEVMCNGKTHLLVEDTAVYFQDVRELYFGDTKAFMLCKAITTENRDGSS